MEAVFRRVLWAVDPFTDSRRSLLLVAQVIRSLTAQQEVKIAPTYLFSSDLFRGSVQEPLELMQKIRISGQEVLSEVLEQVGLKGVRPLRLIFAPFLSVRELVGRTVQLARRWRADLLVAGTHSRSQVRDSPQWIMGSFAETLALESTVSFLLVNPDWPKIRTEMGSQDGRKAERERTNQPTRFERILFCTDFSETAQRAYDSVLQLAEALEIPVTLFHRSGRKEQPRLEHVFEAYPLYHDVVSGEMNAVHQEAWRWADWGRQMKVDVQVRIDSRHRESIAEAILAEAEKKAGMIAMAPTTGSLRAMLLGSTIQKVIHGSIFPVWIVHPRHNVVRFMHSLKSRRTG